MSASNMPPPDLAFLGEDGNISPIWWRYLLTLFDRTGGASGTTDDLASAIALMPHLDTGTAALAATLQAALFASRSMQGQIDALRAEIVAIRADSAVKRITPSQTMGNGEIYAFMRR